MKFFIKKEENGMKRNIMLSLCMFAVLALCVRPVYADTLRLGHHHAVGGQVDKTANLFAELVDKETNGKLKIKVFPAAQLGQEREAFEQLNQGVLDMTITSLGLMDKFWSPIAVETLPFIWRDWSQVEHALTGKFAEAVTKGMLDNSNARFLGILGAGFRDMLFRGDPVTDPEKMKGMKMRSPEANTWIRMFELLGAKPTPVTWGEVYTAMQTGVAEGLESPVIMVLDMKFNEVTKSLVPTHHMFATMGLCINKNRYDKLSLEFQKAVSKAGKEAVVWSTQYAKDGEAKAYDTLKKKGMIIAKPDNPEIWAAKVKPLWGEMATKRPGSDVLIKLLDETK